MTDLGQVDTLGGRTEWNKPKISLEKHLDYKFILSLQGNDVATNLKWIMSSNSIAVMPKPTMETWFMEGKLVGGKHFIEIREDYSDLESQMNFYINNPEICLHILRMQIISANNSTIKILKICAVCGFWKNTLIYHTKRLIGGSTNLPTYIFFFCQ